MSHPAIPTHFSRRARCAAKGFRPSWAAVLAGMTACAGVAGGAGPGAGGPGVADRPPVPRIEGPWVRLAAPPAPDRLAPWGAAEGKRIDAVDFALWRAEDGTWQLVSCIRGTGHPGAGRFLYRWEGRALDEADWEPRGIFLTSRPDWGHVEGRLQAPCLAREEDRWWLVYNSRGAHALTGADGKVFTPWRGPGGETALFEMGRDVMLFDNRERDGQWHAWYTAVRPGRNPATKDHFVALRTAPRLEGPWSDETDYPTLTPPPRGYEFVYAESPFVLYREGWYYRFEQMAVYASRDPRVWAGPPVARLTGEDGWRYIAPEIVEDGEGRLYIAGYQYAGQYPGAVPGIHAARLVFEE